MISSFKFLIYNIWFKINKMATALGHRVLILYGLSNGGSYQKYLNDIITLVLL